MTLPHRESVEQPSSNLSQKSPNKSSGKSPIKSRRQILQGALKLGAVGVASAATLSVSSLAQSSKSSSVAHIDDDVHLLNRITWGVRPEDVERIRFIGRERYLQEQLNPESIADEVSANFPILAMDRQTLFALSRSGDRCYQNLVEGMLARASLSKQQLLERMVEFWSDHFNVPASTENAVDVVLLQQQIRKHAFGNFRNLLISVAKSPAMLRYLDNFVNVAEKPNQNYARELLELHTLGVDGGYSEQDVEEVARAFTGWTIHDRSKTGFYFDAAVHDSESKEILGKNLPAERGIEDGLHVLSLLANHPNTAFFICTKLCKHFVRDTPSQQLVQRLTDIWQAQNGELKPVLLELFSSPEFYQAKAKKYRRPLDFFIAAKRVTGTEHKDWWELLQDLEALGQAPYAWHPPNGYPTGAGAWMSTGGLLKRWDMAMELTHGAASSLELSYKYKTTFVSHVTREINSELDSQVVTVETLIDLVVHKVFGTKDYLMGDVKNHFIDYVSDGQGANAVVSATMLSEKLTSLFGLMLASPQFQWR